MEGLSAWGALPIRTLKKLGCCQSVRSGFRNRRFHGIPHFIPSPTELFAARKDDGALYHLARLGRGRSSIHLRRFTLAIQGPASERLARIMDDLTRMLNSASSDELQQWVYDELRQIARARMLREKPGHTLQATALVHEAWIRLRSGANGQWDNRAHFFAAAGEAMRRILVDSARRRLQLKRGGDMERVELHESQIGCPYDEEKLLQVHEVLNALAVEDPLKAQIVKLRFFVGLNHLEIAEALSLNEKTIRRHWEVAKVRLYELIRSNTGG